MIRVVYASPTNVDTPSFYRGWGPLCALLKETPDMALGKSHEFDWAVARLADVFAFARNHTEGCIKALEICKKMGRFTWVDYDDSFLNIPKSNPNYKDLKDAKDRIRTIAFLADVITVSTPALKEDFSFVKDKVFVLPNAYDDDLLGPFPMEPLPRDKTILWRGSATHEEDLSPIAGKLIDFINSQEFEGWKFCFMGYNPVFITSQIKDEKRIEIVPPLDILDYFAAIRALKPSMIVVPLKDTAFNRCKSNIAWIEGTYAGAMTLASDLPEFRRPGVMLSTEEHFVNTLQWNIRRINEHPEHVYEHWKLSADSIVNSKLLLSEVNRARKQIIRQGAKYTRREMGGPGGPTTSV